MTKLPTQPRRSAPRRKPLSRDRVLGAAIRLADVSGIDAVSMRGLGRALRVEAMSLYKHVASKDDILDGIVDLVTSEFEVPAADVDWKMGLRRSAISAHEVLRRHPWASGLIESRASAGPARMRYLEAVIGVLAAAGFSMPDVLRAVMALDSHTYGFLVQELAWSSQATEASERAASFAQGLPEGGFPNLLAMAQMVATSPQGVPIEFEFGLELLLDGLSRLLSDAGR